MAKSGTVKFFNAQKGFGFIVQDDGGSDLFVHINDVTGMPPRDGDAVQFDAQWDDRKGKEHAVNVSGGTGSAEDGKGDGKGFGKGKGKSGDKGKGKGKGKKSYGGDSYGGGYDRDAPY